MSEKSIKVTDRRMFTAEGQLREDFRHLENVESPPPAAEAVEEPGPGAEPARDAEPEATQAAEQEVPPLRTAPGYAAAEGQRGPQFMDLVGLLAEPASLYLRQAQAAGTGELRAVSEASQNLDLARMHIDLLGVLREKSATSLAPQELAMIDDVIYRLQLAFTQIQGE